MFLYLKVSYYTLLTLTLLLQLSFQTVLFDLTNERHMKRLKSEQESDMLASIATGADLQRDGDNLGILDEDEDVATMEMDDETTDVDESALIIQKLSDKNKNVTNYYPFDDDQGAPLFTRTGEDFDVDFIIFLSPSFPPGSGHYVVLRKLEARTDFDNYLLDEGVSNEDYNNMWSGKLAPPEVYDQVLPDVQSGEENYADVPVGGELHLESNPQPDFLRKLSAKLQDGSAAVYDEVIYESFLVNFKESLHGFISDVDPLQIAFMNAPNYDEDVKVDVDSDDYDSEESLESGKLGVPSVMSTDSYAQLPMEPGFEIEGAGQSVGVATGRRRKRHASLSPPHMGQWSNCLKPISLPKIWNAKARG